MAVNHGRPVQTFGCTPCAGAGERGGRCPNPKLKVMDEVKAVLRLPHYLIRFERSRLILSARSRRTDRTRESHHSQGLDLLDEARKFGTIEPHGRSGTRW